MFAILEIFLFLLYDKNSVRSFLCVRPYLWFKLSNTSKARRIPHNIVWICSNPWPLSRDEQNLN